MAKEYNSKGNKVIRKKRKERNNSEGVSKKEHVPDEDDFERMLGNRVRPWLTSVGGHRAASAGERSALSHQDRCAALVSTSNLPKDNAVEVLAEIVNKQSAIVAVYANWGTREKGFKAVFEEAQLPPAPNDTNPFNVFRREKIHRPQTRRRRENDVSGYEKLLRAKDSLVVARAATVDAEKRDAQVRDFPGNEPHKSY